MLSKRLVQARKGAGLSLRNLAERINLSQTSIHKYEKGELIPSSDILIKIAKALGVRTEYFFRPDLLTDMSLSFRKHKDLPQKQLDIITHKVIEKIERRLELENLFPMASISFADFGDFSNVMDLNEIEPIAEQIRDVWKLGLDPIADLIDTFETHGIRVFTIKLDDDISSDYFDGLYTIFNEVPVIVINEDFPGDRQRFTLAHELGHLIFNNSLINNIDIENACNRFAGAFLFPKESVIKELGESRTSIELKELDLLKHEFGTSMLCILHRCEELGIINKNYFNKTYKLFKDNGWYKKEPGTQYPREKAHFFEQFVFRALAEDCLSESKAAELLGTSLVNFRNLRLMRCTDAVTNQ